MKDFSSTDITRLYREEYAQALNALGRFNLAIFGKTGTGKSTLVNAIFGDDVAATGTGRPVTRSARSPRAGAVHWASCSTSR